MARTVLGCTPRQRAVLSGRVRAVVSRRHPAPSFEAELADGTGVIVLRFLGRDLVPGIAVGSWMRVEGTVVAIRGRRVLLNPLYEQC